MMHYMTPDELQRVLDTTPGNEALADVVQQLISGASPVRVDLNALLRMPDETKWPLPPL